MYYLQVSGSEHVSRYIKIYAFKKFLYFFLYILEKLVDDLLLIYVIVNIVGLTQSTEGE